MVALQKQVGTRILDVLSALREPVGDPGLGTWEVGFRAVDLGQSVLRIGGKGWKPCFFRKGKALNQLGNTGILEAYPKKQQKSVWRAWTGRTGFLEVPAPVPCF